MYQYIVIEIENMEPLKIGAGGSKSNQTEPSKDYIPGSTIRGAIIGEMIRKGVFDENKKDILTKIEFYNAYPSRNGKLYLPTPQHLRMNKHEWRERKMLANQGNSQQIPQVPLTNLINNNRKIRNQLDYRYIAFGKKSDEKPHLVGLKVAKEYRLHHSTSLNKNEIKKENLFRYQAIAKGQIFRAIIRFDNFLADLIQSVLQQTSTLYLGGAKGSGYGLCQINIIGTSLDYPEAKITIGMADKINGKSTYLEPSNHLIITCLSDCICRNEFGQPVNHIPTDYIKEICGHTVDLKDQSVLTGLTEGYNTKWKARYPKETTIKAGSIFVYESTEVLSGEELKKVVQVLENRLIGHRTQDGFGWIGVNIPYPDTIALKEEEIQQTSPKELDNEKLLQEIIQDTDRKNVMNILSKGMEDAKERWLRMICIKSWENHHYSNDGSQSTRDFIISDNLKRHQYMQLIEKVNHTIESLKKDSLPRNELDSKKIIRDYFKDNQICSIAGENFKSIIEYLNKDHNDGKFDKLNNYAKNKLEASRGKVFYLKPKYKEKLFIAELLYTGLYIQHRRKEK